jgi:hypothetical protein
LELALVNGGYPFALMGIIHKGRETMAQFPLLWIERRNYPGFRKIQGLGFDPDYEGWWEKYKRVVTELHQERAAILPVEFDAEEFESYCEQNGIIPDSNALLRYTRLRATEYAE